MLVGAVGGFLRESERPLVRVHVVCGSRRSDLQLRMARGDLAQRVGA